jgi:uncharacterized membrane protein YhaH (DUF805 family)
MDKARIPSGVAIAVLTLWMVIELGCLRGTDGPNEYGDDPLGRARMPQV